MSNPSAKGVALVTGAAQGIGKSIALRLSEDGYDVAINDIPSQEANINLVLQEIQKRGRRSLSVPADVSIEDQVKNMVANVVKELGRLDVMVANAGICRSLKPVIETSVEDWDHHFAVNVRGIFLCYKHAGLQMIAQGKPGGRIIGACSSNGKQGTPLAGTYSSTKFAVRGLTQSMAGELGKHGITVNAYAPGVIDTEMARNAINAVGGVMGDSDAVLDQTIPSFGQPADVAGLVSYLVSKDANFITGQSVSINGGIFFD